MYIHICHVFIQTYYMVCDVLNVNTFDELLNVRFWNGMN